MSEGHSPGSALALLNKTVTDSTDVETFITLFCGILDTRTNELIYANAGHEPALYSVAERLSTLDSTGPAVGLGIEIGYEDKSIILQPGSVLLLYTDGVTEARRGKSFLGTERLGEHLAACRSETSESVARCIYQAALDFSEGEIRDDIAILAVKANQ